MAHDLERAIKELVRREVDAALRRSGVGSTQAPEPARSVRHGYPRTESNDYLRCPRCGHEIFLGAESCSSTTIEGEQVSHTESGIGVTEGHSTTRSVGRGWSYSEGTAETEGERRGEKSRGA